MDSLQARLTAYEMLLLRALGTIAWRKGKGNYVNSLHHRVREELAASDLPEEDKNLVQAELDRLVKLIPTDMVQRGPVGSPDD